MLTKNNILILVTMICLTTLSLPSYARGVAYGSRGGAAARGNYGGAAVRGPHGGTAVRGPAGNTAYRGPHGNTAYRGNGVYRAPVPAYGYRPPVYYGGSAYYNDNHYSSGQVAGAAVMGLAVGAAVGSAAANANKPATTTVIVQPPRY